MRTDPGTVSAAAAVSESSSKVLMAGRLFFFPLYLQPQNKRIALPDGPVSGDLFFNYSISPQVVGGGVWDL